MQNFTNPPSRSTSGQINSKISVPQGKIPASGDASRIKSTGGSVKGFSGGLINPKVGK